MKTIIFVLTLILCGCEGAYKSNDKLIQKAYQDGVTAGRAYCGLDGVDSVMMDGTIDHGFNQNDSLLDNNRYFVISYTFCEKNSDSWGNGNMWFIDTAFPSKKEIDSSIYEGLPLKKSSYQTPLIVSIYEFNDKADYYRFTKGQK